MTLEIVILAAGKGRRMSSDLPKVLHTIGGAPMLAHVVRTAQSLQPTKIHIVYGNGGATVRQAMSHLDVNWVAQNEQLGTGHAVQQALPDTQSGAHVLVLYGDVPLISTSTLQQLCATATAESISLLLANFVDPKGLGRIIRNSHNDILAIVEDKDATDQQRSIHEIFTGIMLLPASDLSRWLPNLQAKNAQGEYYLTDTVAMAVADKYHVHSTTVSSEQEVYGVNDLIQLTHLERCYQRQLAHQLLQEGVMIKDYNRFDVRGELECQPGVSIDINVVFEGTVSIGANSTIAPNCVLRNVSLGEGVKILENSVLEDCVVGDGCHVGPFARLRPGTELHKEAHVGNFVEIKKSQIGAGSKVNHLSYVGDATIGTGVNVGAGTITCNYDGEYKHQTILADGVFIGSGTQLVAPVTIGKNATIGAGSTIRHDAPADSLMLTEKKERLVPGWKKKTR